MPANKLRLCILTCSLVASLCPLFGYYHIEFSHKLVSIFPSGTETTPQCSRTYPLPENIPICSYKRSRSPVCVEIRSVYLFRFSSRISAPLLLLMLLISDLMDSNAAFTSVATDLSQLFRRLHTKTHIISIHVLIFPLLFCFFMVLSQNKIRALSSQTVSRLSSLLDSLQSSEGSTYVTYAVSRHKTLYG